MALVTGPVPLIATTAAELKYPSDAPQTYIVIDNVSPFLVRVGLGGTTHWLPPYTSNVWAAPGNHQPVSLFPVAVPGFTDESVALVVPAAATATWYGPGEGVPGGVYPAALTGPAVEAGLASAGVAGSSAMLFSQAHTIANGAEFSLAPLAAGTLYRVWNWGASSYASAPAADTVAVAHAPKFTTPLSTIPLDTISPASPASSRISGLIVTEFTVQNLLGVSATFYVLHSVLVA